MTRRTGFPPEVAAGVMLRDGEKCAMHGHPLCRGGRADEVNHRLNRGQGGDPREVVNSPANGCAMEHACNWRLEVNAEFAEAARRRGVKLDHSDDDEATIHATPMWSPFFAQWVVLRPSGMFLTGERDATLDARELTVAGSEGSGFVLERVRTLNNPAFEATGASA